ncbi:SDR family NAD(P)-dependent oxidoreductase [Terriglobus aquaticus]|uniref:SDR family NAD(P)-dependent oxidoreductase n=1 Tax=Terriglobus aquaticus TaxID=940139 RepID=A0ABW9KI05_9BACT|nr:SDR family NAD(P)-dependent oxidoreductase [Terriglobus aquaticus]
MRLDGKRALVTGAGRGIGLAAAAALAEAGAHVVLLARSAGEIEAASQAIRQNGGSAEALACDVLDLPAVQQAIADQTPFDILVNNAGTNRPAPFSSVTIEDFDAVLNLNLRSAFFVAQAVAQRMIASQVRGSLIHITSQMGHVGGRERTVYCASKWAMEGMSKSIALDLASHGIRSNTIAPTFIETELTRPFLQANDFQNFALSKIKLGRLGTVEDLMGAVVFLASSASALITGTSIVVDGGWTAD